MYWYSLTKAMFGILPKPSLLRARVLSEERQWGAVILKRPVAISVIQRAVGELSLLQTLLSPSPKRVQRPVT